MQQLGLKRRGKPVLADLLNQSLEPDKTAKRFVGLNGDRIRGPLIRSEIQGDGSASVNTGHPRISIVQHASFGVRYALEPIGRPASAGDC